MYDTVCKIVKKHKMEIKAEKQKIVTYLNSILKNFKGKHIRAGNLIIIIIVFLFFFNESFWVVQLWQRHI